jgi:hypothetical protein
MAEDAESGDTLGSPYFGRSDRNPSTSETSNSDSMASNNAEATDIHPTEGSGPGNEERAQFPAQTQSNPAPVAQSPSVGFAQLPPTPVGLARGQNPPNHEGVRQSPPNLGPVAQSIPVGWPEVGTHPIMRGETVPAQPWASGTILTCRVGRRSEPTQSWGG